MKKPNSAKLSGKLLRLYNKFNGLIFKNSPIEELIAGFNSPSDRKFSQEISDGVYLYISRNGYSSMPIYSSSFDTYTFNFADKDNLPVSVNGLPTHFTANEYRIYSYSFQNNNRLLFSPETDIPGHFEIKFHKASKSIKDCRYCLDGKLHAISGPARMYSDAHNRLINEWHIYGKKYTFGEMKTMVKNPYNIGKHDQLMLKLMLAPIN